MSTTWKTISAQDLCRMCREGAAIDLIDVRTPVEFREVHSVYARNIPLDALKPEDILATRQGELDAPVYVICRSGSRGAKACEAFVNAGFANVVNVDGGTAAWDQAGLPVNRGRKAISLERQVRIAAGFIVLTGSLLAAFVHPWFVGIPAFVGAGLMFAGITDTCAMGMMIARMPWNQVRTSAPVQEAVCSRRAA